ncbi:hypothetical protein C0992_009235, partial [Termitomyces sp. T32_za158]
IPDRSLDERERGPASETAAPSTAPLSSSTTPAESAPVDDDSDASTHVQPVRTRKRRLSTFESPDGAMDPERRSAR